MQTLGICPEKETCVLKERRIVSVSRTSTTASLCGVPSEHTYSRECGSQGVALGWYALPLQGMWYDNVFRYREPRSHALTGIAYQLRVQTLGICPEKETSVLKERRIVSVSRTSTTSLPMRCSFRTHLFSGMRFPGRCPELVCVTPSGYVVRSCFRYLSLDPMP